LLIGKPAAIVGDTFGRGCRPELSHNTPGRKIMQFLPGIVALFTPSA
jgi:hypothetical protein